jgi:hypothetical protein|tara:strand:+ start:5066 stop:5422 length:357 start_codon:yes stop_codon:yes gene_type:complete
VPNNPEETLGNVGSRLLNVRRGLAPDVTGVVFVVSVPWRPEVCGEISPTKGSSALARPETEGTASRSPVWKGKGVTAPPEESLPSSAYPSLAPDASASPTRGLNALENEFLIQLDIAA